MQENNRQYYEGDDQMAWYKERLLNPFARAYENLSGL